jgi:transposase
VLSGRASGTPKTRDGVIEAIRVHQVVYRSAVRDRTAAINRFHAVVMTAPADIREILEQMPLQQRLERARRWRDRNSDDIVVRATRQALRELAVRIQLLQAQAERTETELDVLTDLAAPGLRDLVGVGIHTAARLLVTVGDNPERLHSEAAFAHLCGAAPIRASSGKTNRHRLNRGGDRSANHALWTIVMSRRTCDQRTRTYVARRTAEGLSTREITRCLKRYVAREIYRAITRPLPLAPRGAVLRELRAATGLPLRIVAAENGLTGARLSCIERGITRDPTIQTRIHAWLTAPQPARIAA